MNPHATLESPPALPSLWVAVMGSQQFSVNEERIVAIEQPSKIHPIPRIGSPLLGVIAHAAEFLPHFDIRAAETPPIYFLILETPEGRISVATDQIRPLNSDNPTEISENLSPLPWPTLVSGFHALKAERKIATKIPSAQQHLLLIRVGPTLCAVDPDEVIAIEKHQLQQPLHGMKRSAERLVTLQDGTIVRGLSLVQALEHEDVDAWREPWTVLVKDLVSEERVAVLVEAVLGIESVPEREISTVTVNHNLSTWFSHSEHGNIEWLEIQRWISVRPRESSRKNYGARTLSIDPIKSAGLASDDYAWQSSSSMLVLPREMLGSVGRSVRAVDVHLETTDGRQALFDLGLLLDIETESTFKRTQTGRLLIMKMSSAPDVAVLVPSIRAISSPDAPAWAPLPLVPYSIRSLISGARIVDREIQYCLNAQFLFERLSQAFNEQSLSRAFCGFIDIESPIHQTFD